MMDWYKLVDKKPVKVDAEEITDAVFRDNNRIIGKTTLPDGSKVSTVFLMLDHNWEPNGEPELFESMLFPSEGMNEEDTERYATYEEAVEGHWRMVEKYGGKKPLKREDCLTELNEDLFKI